jgi:predicted RNase H-like nuclease
MSAFGVDGCRSGWFFVGKGEGRTTLGVVDRLSKLIDMLPDSSAVFIDIPIGLHDSDGSARVCDRLARRLLGRIRGSSVFPAPLRAILDVDDYEAAVRYNRHLCGKGLSRQAFAIVPKVREVDELLRRCERARGMVREVHPELCFWAFAGGRPMVNRKKSRAGFEERMEVLESVLPRAREIAESALTQYKRREVARDDIADALVALATALSAPRALQTLPANPPRDARGLPMEMVFNGKRVSKLKRSGLLRAITTMSNA